VGVAPLHVARVTGTGVAQIAGAGAYGQILVTLAYR